MFALTLTVAHPRVRSALTTPTLVLLRSLDRVVAPAMGCFDEGLISGAHVVLVYDPGHVIGTTPPETFTRVVVDFLERQEALVIRRMATLIHR